MKRRQIRLAHPPQHDVLFDRGPDGVTNEPSRNVRQPPELPAAQVAQRQTHGRHRIAGLTLAIHVGARPGLEGRRPRLVVERVPGLERLLAVGRQAIQIGGPPVIVRQRGSLLAHQPPELVEAQLRHQELDAGAGAVAFLAQPREHPGDRLEGRQDLVFGHERLERPGLVRHRPEPASDIHLEAALLDAVHLAGHRDRAEVVHDDESAGVLSAAGERDLELTPEVLDIGVAQQEAHRRLGMRCDIEALVAADSGDRTGGHVSDGVAARLAGRDTGCGKPPHQRGGVVDVDIVELDVLTGGDVAHAVAVFLGQIREGVHLGGREPAERDLDPLHPGRVPDGVGPLGPPVRGEQQHLDAGAVVPLTIVVALSIGAASQARLGEHLVVDLALAFQGELALVGVDLTRQVRWHAVAQCFLPGHRRPFLSGPCHEYGRFRSPMHPAPGVPHRSNTAGMLPPRALRGGCLDVLGAWPYS